MGYTEAQATRRITAMELAFEDALVVGYKRRIGAMTNHPKDRHVLAAAVQCHAGIIVTHNIRDFPSKSLKPLGVAALTPDASLQHHAAENPTTVRHRLHEQASARHLPLADLLERLQRDVPGFTAMLAN